MMHFRYSEELFSAANQDGTVPTISQESIVANQLLDFPLNRLPPLPQHNPVFQAWDVVYGNEELDANTLLASPNSYAVAFALYQLPCGVAVLANTNLLTYDGNAHTVDANGNPLILTISTFQPYCKWNLYLADGMPFGDPAFVTLNNMPNVSLISGVGNAAITYTLSDNTSGHQRSVKISTSLTDYVTIIQDALVCKYSVDVPSTLILPGENGICTIQVTTSPNCSWTASVVNAAKPIGLHVASMAPPNSSPMGSGTVTFGLSGSGEATSPNQPPAFVAILLIAGHSITVYQSPHPPIRKVGIT